MPSYKEKQELADGFGWDEILSTRGICIVKREERPQGDIIDWEAPDGAVFRTFGEMEHLFTLVDGEVVFNPEPVSKFDAIRLLHFNGDNSLAGEFLAGGSPLRKTALDEVAREINAERMERQRALDPLIRYKEDKAFQTRVDGERLRLEASEEARRQVAEAKFAGDRPTPRAVLLSDFLKMEFDTERYLVEGLIPINATVTVVAARKTGKSTFVYNLIHSLIYGAPLLGCFETKPVLERVGFVNYELTKEQSQEWFNKSPIASTDKLAVWNLRGEPNPFRSEEALAEFAKEVKSLNIRVLVLDPFSSAFRGNSLDNDEVKEFFLMTDAFKTASGVQELIIPIHAGWDATRVRGASTLDDHPDAILHLENSKTGVRTFHAFGRDVDVPPGELAFDKSTLLLTYLGELTPEVKKNKLIDSLLALLKSKGELNATALRKELPGGNYEIDKARDLAVERGLVSMRSEKNSKRYSITPEGLAFTPTPALGESASSVEVVSPLIYKGDTTTATKCECGVDFPEPIPFLGLTVEYCDKCWSVGEVTGELIGFERKFEPEDPDEGVEF